VVSSLFQIIGYERGKRPAGERSAGRLVNVWLSRLGVRRIRVTFRGDIPMLRSGGRKGELGSSPPVRR
jgi:hypothetical protein